MTVGETLAEARNRAGLSVDELGQRTKIREQVIRAIEHDDFDSCGGTLYVRGYVRVIAGAVGVDPQGLLRQLDQVGGVSDPGAPRPPSPSPSRPAPQPSRRPRAPRPAPGPAPAVSSGWGAPPVPVPPSPDASSHFSRLERLKRLKEAEDAAAKAAGASRRSGPLRALRRSGPIKVARAGSAETLVDMRRVVPDDAADVIPGLDAAVRTTSFDLPALNDGPPPDRSGSGFGLEPGAGEPVFNPAPVPPPPPRFSERRPPQPPPAQADGGGFVRGHRKGITAIVVLAAIVFVFCAFSTMFSANPGDTAAAPPGGPTASAPAPASASVPAGLTISQCEAWGPNGTADGDNPTTASYPITPGAGQPWITQQYPTAQFGGEKSGSGLLLDMGKVVTVSGVSVDLGSTSGAGLELQAGNSTGSLTSVATATNVSGNIQIRPGQPVTARYLLIWFNQLPQASDGQYQASVYHVSVQGHE